MYPKLIALELTRRCPLKCKHCRADASDTDWENELHLDEVKSILSKIASEIKPIIILTGGEPLLRHDIFEIAEYGTTLGLHMVLATCGQDLTTETVDKLRSSGIRRLSFSIDGATADSHDQFRGIVGAFEKTVAASKKALAGDLPFQINTTVTAQNAGDIEAIAHLAISLGAVSFHPFLLVPTGRAKKLKGSEMSAKQYEEILERIYNLSQNSTLDIKPTCAPHYFRIANITNSRGCLAGYGFAFISHIGKIQTCGFLDVECGDLRTNDYDFMKIWMESEIFQKLRKQENYKGSCGSCGCYNVCGGCRARAHEINGDYLAEEPYCTLGKTNG